MRLPRNHGQALYILAAPGGGGECGDEETEQHHLHRHGGPVARPVPQDHQGGTQSYIYKKGCH